MPIFHSKYIVQKLNKKDKMAIDVISTLTLSSLNCHHCHLQPLQAVNCCRNSRLVVDEDALKWFKN